MSNPSKLELQLIAKDKMSGILKKLTTDIKLLKRESKSALTDLNKLIKAIEKKPKNNFGSFNKELILSFRKSNSEAAKLSKTLESIGKIKSPKIDLSGVSGSPKTSNNQKELDKLFNVRKNRKNSIGKLTEFNEKVLQPGGEIKNVWKEQINSLREYTEETKNLLLAQSKFKLLNLSEADNKKAFDAASQVARSGTVTKTRATELLTDLHTATGDLNHAIEALPDAADYSFSMKTLFGDKFSDSEIETQIQSAYKFLEVTGKVAKGQEEMKRGFNALTQMTNATGGRTTSSEILLMGRRAGASGRNLSEEGLRNLSMPIQELGGSGTGVALMSLYQSLVGGTMKQASKEAFNRLGLIDQSKIEYNKAGKIKNLLPGANKLGDLMMTDPLSAADILREAMKKHGVNTDKPEEISKQLTILFQNRNAQNLMDILINQRGQVIKESDLAKNAQGNDAMKAGMDKKLADLEKVKNAWIDLKTTAGLPLIEVFGKLANSALPVLNFFAQHETLTQWALAAMLAGKGVKLVSETTSILSGTGSGLLSFFKSTKTDASDAAKSVGGLYSNLKSLPTSVQIGLTLAAIGFTWDQITTLRSTIDEWKKTQNNLDAGSAALTKAYKASDEAGIKPDYKSRADAALLSLGGNNELAKALDPKKIGWTEWFGRGMGSLVGKDTNLSLYQGKPTTTALLQNPQYYARVKEVEKMPFKQGLVEGAFSDAFERVASEIAAIKNLHNRAGMLDDPKTMTSFRRDVEPTLGLSDVKKQFLDQLLSQAFPDSFKQSSQLLAEQSGQLGQSFANLQNPMPSLVEQFLGLNTNSNQAVTGINNLATATSNAATRLNAVEFKAPNFGTVNIPSANGNPSANPFSIIPRAKGGSVTRGTEYRINEQGQEYFTPSASGSIISNDALRNAGRRRGGDPSNTGIAKIENNFHINVSGGEVSEKTLRDFERVCRKIVREEMNPNKLASQVDSAARRYTERI